MVKITRTELPITAHSGSFLWFKKIWVGNKYDRLTFNERMAVLSHEMGHLAGHHTEIRILTLIFMPFLYKMVCKKQELLADKYAADHGHAKTLIDMLRCEFDGGHFQPSHAERRQYLEQYEQNRQASVNGYLFAARRNRAWSKK